MNEIKGLVVSSMDYKEQSKIVYLYTPYGHDSVKANKAKDLSKGLLGFTTTLNEVSYIKTKAKFPTLLEYNLLNSHFDLTQNLDSVKVLSIFLKVIAAIPEDINHFKTYDFIIEMLNNFKDNPPKKVLSIFLIKMLYVFGVFPNFKYCMNCESKKLVFFSIPNGGCYCDKCCSNSNHETLNLWKEYYYEKKTIKEYTDTNFDSLLKDIFTYYSIHTHIKINEL